MTGAAISLADLHPADTFLAPLPSADAARWMFGNLADIDAVTGSHLACLGSMPVIAHEGTMTPSGLSAMRDAGLAVPANVISYRTAGDYADAVRDLVNLGLKAAAPFSGPTSAIPPGALLVELALHQTLNNKENLARFVPAASVPARRRLPIAELRGALLAAKALPLVIKVATDRPSGGGAAVTIYHGRRHLRRVQRRTLGAETVILEEFVQIEANHCVQYAMLGPGVRYLGATEQLVDEHGAHQGNFLEEASPPPAHVVELGRTIAEAGAALGYRGIAGFDILTAKDGRALALDLNFRLVSSTPQILLHEELGRRRGLAVSRSTRLVWPGSLEEALRRCRPGIDAGWLVPVATFDPTFGRGGVPGLARIGALLFGQDRADVDRRAKSLLSLGFRVSGTNRNRASRWHRLVMRLASIVSKQPA